MTYQLIDSGDGQKLERFGSYLLIRPSSIALWHKKNPSLWKKANAIFDREKGWQCQKDMPTEWEITIKGIKLLLKLTSFGHVGFFPEHLFLDKIEKKTKILNLFAYTGLGSIIMAKKGAEVCHVDAAKPSIQWAKQNAALNGADNIRWILDDALKFVSKEIRRKATYQGIIMDPPTFGRGAKKELFKIEKDLMPLLEKSSQLLGKDAFLILSSHTPGITPVVLKQLLAQTMPKGSIKSEEMTISAPKGYALPAGCYAVWRRK